MELLQKASSVAMLAFVLCSMLAMGLNLTVGQIITPLRNVRLVTLSLLVNFLLMPFVAVGLATLLRLDEPLGVGLLLLGSAAGAPFLPKLAQIARGTCFRRRLDGAADGHHGGLSAARPAVIVAGRFSEPGEDCPLIVSAHAASSGRRAGWKGSLRRGRHAHETCA
jgi:hypothetical protein